MLITLAKTGSAEMVGEFSYALAVTAPIFMLTNLQLRAAHASDAHDAFTFAHYLAVRVTGTALALGVVTIVAATFVPSGMGLTVAAIGGAKAIEAMSDVVFGLMQRHERMDLIARSLIAKGVLSVAALFAGVRLTGSVAVGATALALAWAIVLAEYDWRQARSLLREYGVTKHVRPDFSGFQQLVRISLPLGIVMLLLSLAANVPRYFIERQRGLGELGVFSAINQLLAAGIMLFGSLGQSATPRLALYHASGNRHSFRRVMAILLAFAVGLGVTGILVALVAGRRLLAGIYRPEYADSQEVLLWTMIAALIAYVASALGYGATAARSFRGQPFVCALMLVATTIGCWILVPRSGLTGATIAVAMGYAVQAAGAAWLVWPGLERRRAAQ